MFKIVRDGVFFRAVNEDTGFRSTLVGSASQAGLIIQRKGGSEAHRAAAEEFLSGRAADSQ